LPRFIADWSRHYDVATEFRANGYDSGDLPRETEVTFYRVTQEALNNVVKHAHATRVDVLLEARDRIVTLVIEDDGVGFDTADHGTLTDGIGLASMRERAALCGATLEIESTPGKGTTVFLRAPLRGDVPAQAQP
jgi:signal transduction histidine kinase